jgi:RHS repeat-associated protein
MGHAAVAKLNSEQSLHAMWQAFRARSLADQQLVENDAGVVRDLLNARYYEGSRGQFISQDPMFWVLPKQLLQDPQLLNSYNYGRDNPITRSDPTGLLTFVIPGTGYDEKARSWGDRFDDSSRQGCNCRKLPRRGSGRRRPLHHAAGLLAGGPVNSSVVVPSNGNFIRQRAEADNHVGHFRPGT